MHLPLSILTTALATGALHAAVEVAVETRTFHAPGSKARVEVNMAFLAGSFAERPNERGFKQARILAVTIIERDGAIVTFAKSDVLGEEHTGDASSDLIHTETFRLAPGLYDLHVEVTDLLSGDTTVTRHRAPLAVGDAPAGVSISDILLADRIEPASGEATAKFGYKVVPLVSDYFPAAIGTLRFYAEVYGTDEAFGADSLYLLTYQLENYEKRQVHGALKRSSRTKARAVEPVIAELDLTAVPSGNYLLALEVRDRSGALVARREHFLQRNNPVRYGYDLQSLSALEVGNLFSDAFVSPDTLLEHLQSLRPIADPLERKIIEDRWKDRDLDLMKRFFLSFWSNRSADPEAAWHAYREQVVKVNKLFSCRSMKGYETDRGIVYLKYGAPNSMMDRFNEMDAYPYTIWHYYRAGKYTNRRFVFYQNALANDCFELLHSEVPGEISNPQWNRIIHSRNVPMGNVQGGQVPTLSGERTEEFYELPR